MSQANTITKEDLYEGLKSNGRKLGIFIAALPASDEEKEAWLEIVKYASLEQIDQLTDTLETLYAHSETAEIDEEFKSELESIRKKYEEKETVLDKETIEKINVLSEEIL